MMPEERINGGTTREVRMIPLSTRHSAYPLRSFGPNVLALFLAGGAAAGRLLVCPTAAPDSEFETPLQRL